MNYSETLAYLFNQLPVYQHIGKVAYKADLNTTRALDEYFRYPHRHFKSIHTAGTNGKGSVSHMLASILQEAGYQCGLYTSPHMKDFRERIKINGQPIPEVEVVEFVAAYKPLFETLKPSFFEMSVALAFYYFQKEKVDFAVVETGLGGRLDSTNIITPVLSIITNIGWDHTDILGNTLEKIAIEKAGIIKQDVPVIIGEADASLYKVFSQIARERKTSIFFAQEQVKIQQDTGLSENNQILNTNIPGLERIECDLAGYYQEKNICSVLKAVELLNQKGYTISNDCVKEGLKKTIQNTGLSGRWQVIGRDPLVICDIAHNVPGILYIVKQLQDIKSGKLHMVMGFVNDKDITGILSVLPVNATYYFCKADIPRGLDSGILTQQAVKAGLKGKSYGSVKAAFSEAKKNALSGDTIFIGGSAFVVAEVI